MAFVISYNWCNPAIWINKNALLYSSTRICIMCNKEHFNAKRCVNDIKLWCQEKSMLYKTLSSHILLCNECPRAYVVIEKKTYLTVMHIFPYIIHYNNVFICSITNTIKTDCTFLFISERFLLLVNQIVIRNILILQENLGSTCNDAK